MIKGKNVLAIVCASSGAKTMARRHTRLLAGKPLVLWTIEAARQSRLVDQVVVITDDSEVSALALRENLGHYPLTNPAPDANLGAQLVSIADVLGRYEYLVVLDAASPLRLSSDIDGALEVSARNDGTPVVTVSEAKLSLGSLVVLDGGRKMSRVLSAELIKSSNLTAVTAASARFYTANNSIAVSSTTYLQHHNTFVTDDTHAYIMPPERALTIESKTDLAVAEGILGLTGPALTMPVNSSVGQPGP